VTLTSPFQVGLNSTALVLQPVPHSSASTAPAPQRPSAPAQELKGHALAQESALLGILTLPEAKQATLDKPRVWVWDGVLPTGTFSIVGAESKAGKTTLMRNLTLAVAGGTPFLGRKTAQGTVLYFMLEDDLEEQVDFHERTQSMNLPVRLVQSIPPEFKDDRGNMLMGYLSDCINYCSPSLVILDMFVNAFPGVNDFNNYVEVSRHMIGLIDLLRTRHPSTAIVATHHMHKARRGESGTNDPNRILGSVAFNGRAYTQIMLDMKEHSSRRYIATIQRGGSNLPRTPLRLDDKTLVLSVDGVGDEPAAEATDPAPAPVRRAVSSVWRLSGGDCACALTAGQICESLGSRARIKHEVENLRAAVHAGWLLREGAGVRGNPFTFKLNPDKLPPPAWRITSSASAAPSAPAQAPEEPS